MKILLVEDDQTPREVLTDPLTAHYYSVECAADGEHRLDLAERFEYDLLLLGVTLPKLSGCPGLGS